MSRKADAEKNQKQQAAATMDSIEAAARKQYEADQAAAQAQAGTWVWNADSGYYYNAVHRWVADNLYTQQRVDAACVHDQDQWNLTYHKHSLLAVGQLPYAPIVQVGTFCWLKPVNNMLELHQIALLEGAPVFC